MYGTVEEIAGGRWRLRFIRELAHPVEKVWRAVTEPEHLAAWFPSSIDGDRAPGAPLRFVFPNDAAPPMDGRVLSYQPLSLFEFQWGTDVIRIELRSLEGVATILTLFHTFDERGKSARDAAGWHTCLDALSAALGAGDVSRELMDRWAAVHPHYVEAFGPEGSSIGPPQAPA